MSGNVSVVQIQSGLKHTDHAKEVTLNVCWYFSLESNNRILQGDQILDVLPSASLDSQITCPGMEHKRQKYALFQIRDP